MKRYWIFFVPEYEGSGGMRDFDSSADDLEDAIKSVDNNGKYSWSHVYDSVDNKIVYPKVPMFDNANKILNGQI